MTCQTQGGEILGIPGKIPDDDKVYLHNQRMGKVVIKEPKKIDADFLYWVFLWNRFNQELVASATGTKILHTAPKRIEAFEFNESLEINNKKYKIVEIFKKDLLMCVGLKEELS